ncbi:hypothetical protein PPERSA_08259 [Pseudocohnilembus persalinus]|uniref:Uncharacterized protein n=1 Tax=Pseudocohnilembus persalinus TaxID=266149 RepID=A0A0V0QG12_PSEPJ|nr:hypothetical protein PPERSA_08259 [Pseudocohnilembus persalinus]|eukprot:KRX01158.1 hypothetical protein PPERSA_08259 [Pseudocohnilembus persalinus]
MIACRKGWIISQNGEQLEDFDNKELVFFQYFQDVFFTSTTAKQEFQNKVFALNYDFSVLLRSLKSVKFSARKLMFQFYQKDLNEPDFYNMDIHLLTDEGQLHFQKGFYNNRELAIKFDLYRQTIQEFEDDKTLYLSVNGKYLKQLKEMRNYPTEWKMQEQNLVIKSPNQPEMKKIHVDRTLFEIYNYEAFQNQFKGNLLLPSNYFDPHLFLQQKSKAPKFDIYFQTVGFGGNKSVVFYVRTKTEQYQFFHAFICVEQELQEDQFIDISKGSINQNIDQTYGQQNQLNVQKQQISNIQEINQNSQIDRQQSISSNINVFKQYVTNAVNNGTQLELPVYGTCLVIAVQQQLKLKLSLTIAINDLNTVTQPT